MVLDIRKHIDPQIPFWTAQGTVNLADLRPENMTAGILADALAKTNRFSGRTPLPWPVTSHSVLVEGLVQAEHGPWALLHDAHEVFIGDITTPAVELIALGAPEGAVEEAIAAAKGRVDRAIARAWQVPPRSLSLVIRRADRVALLAEAIVFLGVRPQFLEPGDEEDIDRAITLLREMPTGDDWRISRDLWLARIEHYSQLGRMTPPKSPAGTKPALFTMES